MKKSESYKKWIEVAYLYFATEGPDNISVMELAKQCGLPRTNFYYYFENKEELIENVIQFHFKTTTEIFNNELENRLQTFIPDLYVIVHESKLGMQFTKQLFLHREKSSCNDAYMHGVALSADIIVPKFMEFFKVDLPLEKGKLLWYTLTDAWYARLDFNNYTVESLIELCYEVVDSVTPLLDIKR